MFKLKVISSTVRDHLKGYDVAEWITEQVKRFGKFDVELINLAKVDLPFFKDPNLPKAKDYVYDTTKKWSKTIEEADAFIFVLAEYNHSYPAPLKNALDTISLEWSYKPAGIVSYAGISGGVRAVNDLSHVFLTLKIIQLPEGVIFNFFEQHFNTETGAFQPPKRSEESASKMLEELHLWTRNLINIRKEKGLMV